MRLYSYSLNAGCYLTLYYNYSSSVSIVNTLKHGLEFLIIYSRKWFKFKTVFVFISFRKRNFQSHPVCVCVRSRRLKWRGGILFCSPPIWPRPPLPGVFTGEPRRVQAQSSSGRRVSRFLLASSIQFFWKREKFLFSLYNLNFLALIKYRKVHL